MRKFFSGNWIILVIGVAFITSTALAIRNTYVIDKNQLIIQQADLIKETTQEVLTSIMHGLDLGVRGYGLTRDEKLLVPYEKAVDTTPVVFRTIDSLLTIQNYPDRALAGKVMEEVGSYIRYCKQMINMARYGDMDSFSASMKEDRGYKVWAQYSEFSTPLFVYENNLREAALAEYKSAMTMNLLLQVAISLFGLPVLFLFIRGINRERQRRRKVLEAVDHSDRNFVFDSGVEHTHLNEGINERALDNIKVACDFVTDLADDKYDVEWKGMSAANESRNKKTLAGNLVRLRERLKAVKVDDQRRNWVNEGLAKFAEIVRTNQNNHEKLVNESVTFLTKYIKAQQGSLFVVRAEQEQIFLNLEGCFAFDRRKWIEKKVLVGNGLLGQAYLEGAPVVLTEIPQGYTSITSGLGDATPNCLVIIPMKNNNEIAAVAEFATFGRVRDYEIGFLDKAGEILASTMINAENSAKMKKLLEEATRRETMMREHEEELRQNMEELQATKEQMQRARNEA